jgi:hypothetical protein
VGVEAGAEFIASPLGGSKRPSRVITRARLGDVTPRRGRPRRRRKRLIEYIVYTGADDDAPLLSPTDGRQVCRWMRRTLLKRNTFTDLPLGSSCP